MNFELLQPWSTFVMKTKLSPPILEKMMRITDEIIENNAPEIVDVGAHHIKDQFKIGVDTLIQEEVLEFFLTSCNTFIMQAFCQSQPFNKETILKEVFLPHLSSMWVNCQKDNEYLPVHHHTAAAVSAIMYLKIPELLPGGQSFYSNKDSDGTIIFTNNVAKDNLWGTPILEIQPEVGDFFIYPASLDHQVNPFSSPVDGERERRSIAFNAVFTTKGEQDFIKKQKTI